MEQNNSTIAFALERDIIKKYRKQLWGKFIQGLKEYHMIEPNDRVCVAISGGKDSLLLAKLLQEVQKHGDIPFELEFLCMNPGFNQENLTQLEENCKLLEIPVKIINSDVFEVAEQLSPNNPCYMCARMRRGFLYQHAQNLGCNKLALGHHFNDVIETTIMNILYAGNFKTMVPKIQADNFENMELIRPMFFIKEKDIIRIMKVHNIKTMNCGCKVAAGALPSKRRRVKQLIAELKLEDDVIDQNIFKSAENINLNAILGYKEDDKVFHFLDLYERRKKE